MKSKACLSCGKKLFINVLSLGNTYLSDFVDKDHIFKIPSYPLSLILCKNCYLLQLKEKTPLSKLYTNSYGYISGINQTMRKELAEIVKQASKIVHLKKNDIVLDIGCNDGTLLNNYSESVIRIGFDPVEKFSEYFKNKNEIFINNYFNSKKFANKFPGKKARIITAISMFYDLNDPNHFLEDIKSCLSEDGIFIIQQNYLAQMLSQNAFDNIVHEHIEYYSLLSLSSLLNRHGLEVIDVSVNNTNGGSFRTIISRKRVRKISPNVKKLTNEESKLKLNTKIPYVAFANRIKLNAKKLRDFINQEVKKGKKVYVYGASTRGNTLLQYAKLNNKLITKAVERNPEKWGKFIASCGIPIISEAEARKEQPDYMLVLPWFFKDEFIKREGEYLKKGGKFIFPLPKMEIVSKP